MSGSGREKPEEKRQEEIASWESMSIEEHMAYYEEQGMDNKSAMKQVAKDRVSENGKSISTCMAIHETVKIP